jgi:hypothetical protein
MQGTETDFEAPTPTYEGTINLVEGRLPPGAEQQLLVEGFFALVEHLAIRCANWALVVPIR